ncbi:MAG TPA: oligosaccharide flippase family protein [Longimicrobiales bacterium]|nr:oligosaccharide flippase family protein [Longimicrobiales bacterium]
MSGLRSTVYRGGGYLAARQVMGMVLSAGSVLALTRLLGPATYGLYAAALALQLLAQTVAGLGVQTYLVRLPGEAGDEDYDHALSFLLVAGAAATLVSLLALPAVEHVSRLELGLPALVLFAATPVQLVAAVPMARIERALDFRSVARIELSGQVAFVAVAVTLAFAGYGIWAPILGFWVQHLVNGTLYFGAAHYRPHWRWSSAANRAMIRFGSGYTVSVWVWHARRLVNPMVVGRYLGSEGVAYVALATQLAAQLGFIVSVAWRLSTATLARLQDDPARTARAIAHGMHLQALAVGVPLVVFGWFGDRLVPLLFGATWAPVMQVYPAIALGFLASSVFMLQSSALSVRHRNWEVTAFHASNVLLLGGTALVLVPRLGLAGYALAEVVALLSYGVLHLLVRLYIPRFWHPAPALACAAFAVALVLPQLWVLGLLLTGAVLLARPTRVLAGDMWNQFRGRAYDG